MTYYLVGKGLQPSQAPPPIMETLPEVEEEDSDECLVVRQALLPRADQNGTAVSGWLVTICNDDDNDNKRISNFQKCHFISKCIVSNLMSNNGSPIQSFERFSLSKHLYA